MLYKLPPIIIFGFASGVFFRSFFYNSWPFALLIIIVSIFLFLFSRLNESNALIFISIFLFIFGLGVLRYEIKDASAVSAELRSKIGQKILLTGFISEEPDERENSSRLILKTDSNDKIILTTNRYPKYSYGDIVEIRGILKEPENFSDDFDYRAYLAKDEIFLEMVFPELSKVGSSSGSKLKSSLLKIKKTYLSGLSSALPEPQAAFLGALTVGARRAIPEEIIENFRKSGIIHIIVLSGFHVMIVARFIGGVAARFLPHFLSSVAGLAGILLFAILTGASATVVRASIMASILYFAGLTGKVYQSKIALFVAGLIMILLNPKILRFDLGFQLSFLATAGILYFGPFIEKVIWWLPKKFNIREYAKITISAQTAVTPLLIYAMGQFSLLAVPANILVVGFVPITMFFGFLTGTIGALNQLLAPSSVEGWLALPASLPAYALSSYIISVGSFFAKLPFSSLNF